VARRLLGAVVRVFAEDRNRRSARFYRFVNEVPTVVMAVIVVFALVEPL
jgi:putative membrane protein